MSFSGVLLGGAKNRLLPASVPFGFFATAAFFQIIAWLLIIIGSSELPGFAGGKGLILAAVHALTVGVLAMTAIGASFQLLPVATRQPLLRVWPARVCFWLMMPGTMLLVYGMSGVSDTALYAGAFGVVAGLAVFAALLADNLRKSGKMPVIAAHGWGSLIALAGFVLIGILLLADFDFGFLQDRRMIVAVHMILATFGFIGLLVLGFSQILIPMFALSPALRPRPGRVQLALAGLALSFSIAGILLVEPALTGIAGFFATATVALYLWQMQQSLAKRMRKRLGLAFILIKGSWIAMLLGILIGWANDVGVQITNGAALFGFLILVGWLLSFLTGVLQRIIPFLASMHASGRKGKSPLLSELTPDRPLKVHTICHFLAVVVISVAIVLDLPIVVQTGAAIGFIGSLAFAVFVAIVIIRLNTAKSVN